MSTIHFSGVAPAYDAREALLSPSLSPSESRDAKIVLGNARVALESLNLRVHRNELRNILALKKKQAKDHALSNGV